MDAHKEEVDLSEAINDTIGVAVGNRKLGECYCELLQFENAIRHQKQHLNVPFDIFYHYLFALFKFGVKFHLYITDGIK